MVSGGAGALVWMWISACFGLSSKFSECMLAIKYRKSMKRAICRWTNVYNEKGTQEQKAWSRTWMAVRFICRDRILRNLEIRHREIQFQQQFMRHFGISVSTVASSDHYFSLTDHHRWNKNDIKSIFCRSSSDGNLLCDRRSHRHSWEYQ